MLRWKISREDAWLPNAPREHSQEGNRVVARRGLLRVSSCVNKRGRRERAAGSGSPVTCGCAGGQGRGRTADLPIFSRTLVPTELPGLARHEPESHGRSTRYRSASGCTESAPGPRGGGFWNGFSRGSMLTWHGSGRARPPSSSGLGRRPFTAVARVRIPLGVLYFMPADLGKRRVTPPPLSRVNTVSTKSS